MEYANSIREYFVQNKIKPKSYDVYFTHSIINTILEYEIFYLTHESKSEYMMDWISLSFTKGVKVPDPPHKRLSPMEKEYRLQMLWNALGPRTASSKTSSFIWVLIAVFFFVCIFICLGSSFYKNKNGYVSSLSTFSKQDVWWWILIIGFCFLY